MFFFWLGTVPSLTFLSYLSKKVFDYLPGNIVKVAGFILIFVGVFNLMINFIPTDGQSIHSHKGHALSVHEEMVREGENE